MVNLFFALAATFLTLTLAIDRALVADLAPSCSVISRSLRLSLIVRHSTCLNISQLFLFHALAFFLKHSLVRVLVLVQLVDKKLNIIHVVDAKTLANGVNLDFELLFG